MMMIFINLSLSLALYIPISFLNIQVKNLPKKALQFPDSHESRLNAAHNHKSIENNIEFVIQDKKQLVNLNLNINQKVLSLSQKKVNAQIAPSSRYFLPDDAYLLQRRDFDVGLLISNEAALLLNHVLKENIKSKTKHNHHDGDRDNHDDGGDDNNNQSTSH